MSVRGDLRPLVRVCVGGAGRGREPVIMYKRNSRQSDGLPIFCTKRRLSDHSGPRCQGALTAWLYEGCATAVCCVLYITLYVAYAPSSTTADDNRLQQAATASTPVLQYVLGR